MDSGVKRVRILLGDLPSLMREILHNAIASMPEFEVMADVADIGSLVLLAAEQAPDVVITTAAADNPRLSTDLLTAAPASRVLLVAPDGRQAVVYELRPHATALGDPSLQTLIDAIRATPALDSRSPA